MTCSPVFSLGEKFTIFHPKNMGNIGSFSFTSIISTILLIFGGQEVTKISVHHKIGKKEHLSGQFKQCRPTNILHDLMYKRTGDSGPG
jgi:hypothetical protein